MKVAFLVIITTFQQLHLLTQIICSQPAENVNSNILPLVFAVTKILVLLTIVVLRNFKYLLLLPCFYALQKFRGTKLHLQRAEIEYCEC